MMLSDNQDVQRSGAPGEATSSHRTLSASPDALARTQPYVVAIEPQLLAAVREMAAQRGLSTETLVNLWLQQRVQAVIDTTPRYREYG